MKIGEQFVYHGQMVEVTSERWNARKLETEYLCVFLDTEDDLWLTMDQIDNQ